MTRKVVYILDTSAILAGFPLIAQVKPQITTSYVVKEVLDPRSKEVLETALEIGRLVIEDPEELWIKRAKQYATSAGTHKVLSDTDITVLALALKYKHKGYNPIVLTDDYKLQITLKKLKIAFKPVKTYGIGFKVK